MPMESAEVPAGKTATKKKTHTLTWWYRRNTTRKGVRAPKMAQVAMQDPEDAAARLEITVYQTEPPKTQDLHKSLTKAMKKPQAKKKHRPQRGGKAP